MAIIYSADVIEIAVRHLVSGRTSVNVWHVKLGVLDTGGPEANARDFLDNWQDHVMPLLTNNVVLQGAEYRSLDRGNSESGFLIPDDTKPTVGEIAGAASPPNVTWLIRKQVTGRARGEKNGRCYVSGVEEAGVSAAGVVGGDYPGLWSTALDDLYSGVAGGIGPLNQLVVLTIPKAARVKGDTEFDVGTNEVTQLQLDPMVATQRRRLR